LKGYFRYFGGKMVWILITFTAAFLLNFLLPRLMPGDPVAAITGRVAQGIDSQAAIQRVYEQYTELFGTNLHRLVNLVDGGIAAPGDRRRLADRERTRRLGCLSQGRL